METDKLFNMNSIIYNTDWNYISGQEYTEEVFMVDHILFYFDKLDYGATTLENLLSKIYGLENLTVYQQTYQKRQNAFCCLWGREYKNEFIILNTKNNLTFNVSVKKNHGRFCVNLNLNDDEFVDFIGKIEFNK